MEKRRNITGVFTYIFLLLIWCSPFAGFSQVIPQRLVSNLDSLAGKLPKQTVYLQANKDIYESGEDLWFKAYLLDSRLLTPSVIDTTLYVQLLNDGHSKVIWQGKYKIEGGFVSGHLVIPDTLVSGDYLLAAYSPSSFLKDTTGFYSFRKVRIRKKILGQLSVIPEFVKPVSAKDTRIQLKLKVLAKSGYTLAGASVEAALTNGNRILSTRKNITGTDGTTTINFSVSVEPEGDLQIKVRAAHQGLEEFLSFPVPVLQNSKIRLSMFPEGGNLVEGISNSLAFIVKGNDGRPLEIKGNLLEDGHIISTFKSNHLGMGKLSSFVPKNGKRYQVKMAGNDSIYELPQIYRNGLSLQLREREKGILHFKILRPANQGKERIYVAMQMRGIMGSMFTAELSSDSLKADLPTGKFPQGIVEVTLLNSRLESVAERLVYVNSDKQLNISTKLLGDTLHTREKETLEIQVTDSEGKPQKARLSLSIYEKLFEDKSNSTNILSHIYLSTQLKGRIIDPGYYFDAANPDREETLDLLMLTQGWRRYAWGWQNLKASEKGMPLLSNSISAKSLKNKKELSASTLVLLFTATTREGSSAAIQTDASGNFRLSPQNLEKSGGEYVYLKPIGSVRESKNIRIIIGDPFLGLRESQERKDWISPVITNKIKESGEIPKTELARGAIFLNEVTINAKKEDTFRDKYMAKLDSLTKLNLCTDYVGKCYLLNCPACGGGTKPVEGKTYNLYTGNNPDIMKHRFYFTKDEMKKVTYHYPKYNDEELLSINNLVRLMGYQAKKEFYVPGDNEVKAESQLPDYRNALVWAPEIVTDENGKAAITFFSSDIKGAFVGKIEGLNDQGSLGTKRIEFNVMK